MRSRRFFFADTGGIADDVLWFQASPPAGALVRFASFNRGWFVTDGIRDANGKVTVYTNVGQARCSYPAGSQTACQLVQGLQLLKLISEADLKKFYTKHHLVAKRASLREDVSRLRRRAKELGYKIVKRSS